MMITYYIITDGEEMEERESDIYYIKKTVNDKTEQTKKRKNI